METVTTATAVMAQQEAGRTDSGRRGDDGRSDGEQPRLYQRRKERMNEGWPQSVGSGCVTGRSEEGAEQTRVTRHPEQSDRLPGHDGQIPGTGRPSLRPCPHLPPSQANQAKPGTLRRTQSYSSD